MLTAEFIAKSMMFTRDYGDNRNFFYDHLGSQTYPGIKNPNKKKRGRKTVIVHIKKVNGKTVNVKTKKTEKNIKLLKIKK